MGEFQGAASEGRGWRVACAVAALLLLAGTLVVPVETIEYTGGASEPSERRVVVTDTTLHGAWEYVGTYLEDPGASWVTLLGAAWALITALVCCAAAAFVHWRAPSAWLLVLSLVVLLVLGAAHAVREPTAIARLFAGVSPKVSGPKPSTIMALAAVAIAASSVVGPRHGASRWLALGGGLVLVVGLLTSTTMRGIPPGAPATIGPEVLLRQHILFDQVLRFDTWSHAWASSLMACGFLALGLLGLLQASRLGAGGGVRRVGLGLAWLLFLGIPVLSWIQIQALVPSNGIGRILLGTTSSPASVARGFVLQGGYLLSATVALVGVMCATGHPRIGHEPDA